MDAFYDSVLQIAQRCTALFGPVLAAQSRQMRCFQASEGSGDVGRVENTWLSIVGVPFRCSSRLPLVLLGWLRGNLSIWAARLLRKPRGCIRLLTLDVFDPQGHCSDVGILKTRGRRFAHLAGLWLRRHAGRELQDLFAGSSLALGGK